MPYHIDVCIPLFIASLFIIDDEWIMNFFPNIMENYINLWKIKFVVQWTYMKIIILYNIIKIQKDKYSVFFFICGFNT